MEALAMVALHHPWVFAGYTLFAMVWGMAFGHALKERFKDIK